jgi:nicotinate-nucleotide--dimethylbenzimidazole phosphoribosyltransferase
LVITELGCDQKTAAYSLIKALFHDIIPQDYVFSTSVHEAVAFHGINHAPLELLRRMGSREIAAMIGTIIAARYQNVPIILDGLSAVVAAALIARINPHAIEHCLLGHTNDDVIYNFLISQLSLEPIAFLNITHDAGIGSTIAINIIKTALAIHNYTNR